MSRKKNEDLKILIFFWILASYVILFILSLKTNDRVEAWAIVTLVFVTIYYAIQTKRLVKQEKISLEDAKEKRSADFWQQRLNEFYMPLKVNLFRLKTVLEFKPFSVDEMLQTLLEFIELSKKAYMLSEEFNDLFVSFVRVFKPVADFRKEPQEETWKDEIIEELEKLSKQVEKEIRIFEYKINKVFGFNIDDELKKYIEWLETEYFKEGLIKSGTTPEPKQRD